MPISQRLLAVLGMRRLDPSGHELPRDAYVFGDSLGRRVRSVGRDWEVARDKAGLHHWHLADLRHESSSRYEQAGVPVSTVSRLLGHTNLTDDYHLPEHDPQGTASCRPDARCRSRETGKRVAKRRGP